MAGDYDAEQYFDNGGKATACFENSLIILTLNQGMMLVRTMETMRVVIMNNT